MDTFVISFAACIPHNLHDEVFKIMEILLEIHYDYLNQDHIMHVLNALIDKYTMRSQAHKRLCTFFIDTVLKRSAKEAIVVSSDG